jgi:Rieske 2Fe-2S family protein
VSRAVHHTLSGHDYTAPSVYAVERERVFFRHWYYACRAERLAEPGAFVAVDVVGESIIVVRGRDGALRAFYNVCRHRGSRLCDEAHGQLRGAIKCPYHAWSYGLDGCLIGTPNVDADEVDRASLSLWPAAVDVWEGFVFVHLGEQPEPLEGWLADQDDDPLTFSRFRLGELRTARRTERVVEANWKIVVENYNECLHCPTVHPELVALIPTYRRGSVVEDGRDDGGVSLAPGATSLSNGGRSTVPVLPGLSERDATSYFGAAIFPNLLLDIAANSAVATALVPLGPDRTLLVSEYLFRQEAIAEPGFDPSDVVDFNELIASQDAAVCERVQLGVSSRAFTHGVLAEKDGLLASFNARYLAARGDVTTGPSTATRR